MEFSDVVFLRRSCRKFLDKKVEDKDIETLLHYAMSAPSALNIKPWKYLVIKDEDILTKIRNFKRFANYNAPLAIVLLGDLKKDLLLRNKKYWYLDLAASTENILLGATSLSLGSCWIGIYPNEESVNKLKEILNIEDNNLIPFNIIYIGYPYNEPKYKDGYDNKNVKYYE